MTQPGTDVVLSEKTLQEFARMVVALEEFENSGTDSILDQIFTATTLDEFNGIFGGDRALPLNRSIKVDRLRYAKSEFAAGLPFYLVIDGEDTTSREKGQWVTGATTVVAMLVRAAFLGMLPLIGHQEESSKPTANGYRPINWIMEAMSQADEPQLPTAKAKDK